MSDDDGTAVSSLRAVAHPVRLRILSLLTGAAMSAAEIARELDLTHANASYHLRVLADAGAVVEAGEEKIRGGVAKRYRHPWDRQLRSTGGPEDRELYVRATAEELPGPLTRWPSRRTISEWVACCQAISSSTVGGPEGRAGSPPTTYR